MIRRINEGFQNESFVAYYKGKLFYTGELDYDFRDAMIKLMENDYAALKSVSEYLDYAGIEDFDANDPGEVAYLLEQDMYYDAIDGQDYWNFDNFEIFPEYELGESVRKRSKKSMNEREYRHYLSNNPTDYERLLNYAETFVHTCEITTDEAERYLRNLENNAEFYTDEKNSRWMGIDEKMNKISRLLEQVEKLRRAISKLGG